MKPKRMKEVVPPPPPTAEVTARDREALTEAYKSGLIVAWKRDDERGYRVTLTDRRDEYVEVAKLAGYLERVRNGTAGGGAPAVTDGRRVPSRMSAT